MKEWLVNHLPESIAGLIATVAGWLAQRAITKFDRQEARISALERQTVKKEDLDELRESMNSTFTHGMERIERRTDQILFHMAREDE
jgi:hypothetical protein